jgi:hypothetical protein
MNAHKNAQTVGNQQDGGSAWKPAEFAAFCDFMGICALLV